MTSTTSGSTTDLGSYEDLLVQREEEEEEGGETADINDLPKVTWRDLAAVGDDGQPTSILGIPLTYFNVKKLRTICSKLGIRGVKNVKKHIMIDAIQMLYVNKKAYAALGMTQDPSTLPRAEPPRKEVQCSYRLLNILFSDEFADDFGNLGNVASRELLDGGAAGNDEHFWSCLCLR